MKKAVVATMIAALATSACATREQARELQMPAAAPTALVIFPEDNRFRDAVVLEFVGGVSQHSYVFAEPNGAIIRTLLNRAMRNAGIAAGTPTRARYGLRVYVTNADGPNIGGQFDAGLSATYVIVDRRTQAEVFRSAIDAEGASRFLRLHEGDLRTATQRSWTGIRATADAGLGAAVADIVLDEADRGSDYSAWSDADWDRFGQVYSQSIVAAAVLGPVSVGAEFINPWNFLPWADDEAAAGAHSVPHNHEGRIGSDRAAHANYRAAAASVSGFLLALVEDQNIDLVPILPCYGDAEMDALKRALLASGRAWQSDACNVRR